MSYAMLVVTSVNCCGVQIHETSESARREELELDASPNEEDKLSGGQVDLISLAQTQSVAE